MSDDLEMLGQLDILDQDLEDLPDLAGFDVPVNGQYHLLMSTEVKEVNEKPAVEVSYVVKACIKQDKDTDTPTPLETKFSQLFFLKGKEEAVKMSLGKMKELFAGVSELAGSGNLKVIINFFKENPAMVEATVRRVPDKEDKEKFYARVKNVVPV